MSGGDYIVRVRVTGPGVMPYWKEMGILEQQMQLKWDSNGYGAPMWLRKWCWGLECVGVFSHDRWVVRADA